MVLLEGCNLSEGRETSLPCSLVGAPSHEPSSGWLIDGLVGSDEVRLGIEG
jgi:uncharacterized protein YbbC (DUF1343 family)